MSLHFFFLNNKYYLFANLNECDFAVELHTILHQLVRYSIQLYSLLMPV